MYPGEKSEVSFRTCVDLNQHPHLSNILNSNSEKAAEKNVQCHWITLQYILRLIPESIENQLPIYRWPLEEKMKEAKEQYESAVKLFKVCS